MAQFENMEQAAQALAEASSSPDTPAQSDFADGAAVDNPNQLGAQPSTTQGDQGDQVAEPVAPAETFTPSKDIDLSGLNEEQLAYVQAREKEMQAHFTQETQRLAESRQEAEQAVQFINELNSNPYFAAQVVSELSQQLQAAGVPVAQADAAALQQAQGLAAQGQPPAQEAEAWDEDGFGDDPYLKEIEATRAQLGEITNYLAQQQEQQRVAGLEAQLNNMVAYVQSQNPDFTEGDMAKIVNMAYAYAGDIPRAAEDYKAIREGAVEAWVNRKESVTAPATIDTRGSAQAAPEKFDSVDDPRLEAAAIQRLNEALGQ